MKGFERWESSNPGGTIAQYKDFLIQKQKETKLTNQSGTKLKCRFDPSGTLVFCTNEELGQMNREFVQSGQNQQ